MTGMDVSRAGWVLVALAASMLVSACGNDGGGSPVPVTPTTTEAGTSTTSAAPRSTTTAAPTTSAVAAQVADYAGEQTGTYYFTSPSTKFECAIITASTPVAGCHGAFPADAPRVPRLGTGGAPVPPNAVRVTSGSAGEFVNLGDPAFHRFEGPARVLPYGSTLKVQGFTCSVDERAGVTCERPDHGFTVSDSAFRLW